MKALRRSWNRLLGALFGGRRDGELAEEIESHIQLFTEDNIRAGMTPAEARRAALLRFGGVETAKESLRDQRGLPGAESFLSDVRYALRQLRTHPSFTLIAALTLATGIAASTAISSVVYGVLMAPLPYPEPQRLVQVLVDFTERGGVSEYLTGMDFLDIRDNVEGLESIACSYNYRVTGFNLETEGGTERVRSLIVSSQFFDVYGTAPILGRTFTEPEEREGVRLAMISHGPWQRCFAGDRGVVGQMLRADGVGYEIVGVMPEGFRDVRSGVVDVWTPHNTAPDDSNERDNFYITVVARLADGVSLAQAQAEIQAVRDRLALEEPEVAKTQPRLVPLADEIVGGSRGLLYALLAGAGMVLLIACVNLGAMLLVRGSRRQRELATRAALGSSRARLVRQLLTENLTLAALGGSAGMALGMLALEGLTGVIPESIPRVENIAFDWRIFVAGCALTMLTAMLFGLIPSLRASRVNLEGSLRESFRGGTPGRGQHRLHQGLTAVQVALAVIVLVGAGLLTKSFGALLRTDLGFAPEHVLSFEVSLPEASYPEGPDRARLYGQLQERVAALPGVTAVGATSWLPASGRYNSWGYGFVGLEPGTPTDTDIRVVQGDYFRAMGIQLAEGRLFDTQDREDSQPVVVVSESLARRHWKEGEVLGKVIGVGNGDRKIVGVVRDTRYNHRVDKSVVSYIPHEQFSSNRNWPLKQVVKAEGDPTALLRTVEGDVASLDPTLVVHHVQTVENIVSSAIARERFAMLLMSAFGWTALVLAVVGIYGVLSYVVAQRTREIGIRMALGAARTEIVGSIVGRALKLTAIGGIAGAAAAVSGGQWLNSLLYDVSPVDPTVFAAVLGLTAAAAIAASAAPANRAVNIDPVQAIREE